MLNNDSSAASPTFEPSEFVEYGAIEKITQAVVAGGTNNDGVGYS